MTSLVLTPLTPEKATGGMRTQTAGRVTAVLDGHVISQDAVANLATRGYHHGLLPALEEAQRRQEEG